MAVLTAEVFAACRILCGMSLPDGLQDSDSVLSLILFCPDHIVDILRPMPLKE